MTILKILEFPDERLRIKAKPVLVFDSNLKKLVGDMAETMYAAPGIGLAATQVNIHKRVIVVDVSLSIPPFILVSLSMCLSVSISLYIYLSLCM